MQRATHQIWVKSTLSLSPAPIFLNLEQSTASQILVFCLFHMYSKLGGDGDRFGVWILPICPAKVDDAVDLTKDNSPGLLLKFRTLYMGGLKYNLNQIRFKVPRFCPAKIENICGLIHHPCNFHSKAEWDLPKLESLSKLNHYPVIH